MFRLLFIIIFFIIMACDPRVDDIVSCENICKEHSGMRAPFTRLVFSEKDWCPCVVDNNLMLFEVKKENKK